MAVLALRRFRPGTVALLRVIAAAAGRRARPVLVGGAIRDVWLARRDTDLDLAVPGGAAQLAAGLATRLGGTVVTLDPERGAARVVAGRHHIDVSDFRGPDLAADLAARDFTVNALAVDLRELLAAGRARVVDPTGGLTDLRARRLRVPHARVLDDDPLRALRGVRLEATLGLRLTPATARAIRTRAAALAGVAPERVRDELSAMLALPTAARALRRADALGLLVAVLPEVEPMRGAAQPPPHRFSVLEHSLRAVAGADRLLVRLGGLEPQGEELAAHLAASLGGGWDRARTLKLGALLHDVAKPETARVVRGRLRFFQHDVVGAGRARRIGERWRLPARVTALLERLVRHHLRPMHLAQAATITRRARYRFYRDLGEDARDLLLLAVVDAAAVRGVSPLSVWRQGGVVRELLRGWPEQQEAVAAPPLVRGEDVMRHFGIGPGPAVGRLLARAREAQALGRVATREEALAYLDSAADAP